MRRFCHLIVLEILSQRKHVNLILTRCTADREHCSKMAAIQTLTAEGRSTVPRWPLTRKIITDTFSKRSNSHCSVYALLSMPCWARVFILILQLTVSLQISSFLHEHKDQLTFVNKTQIYWSHKHQQTETITCTVSVFSTKFYQLVSVGSTANDQISATDRYNYPGYLDYLTTKTK